MTHSMYGSVGLRAEGRLGPETFGYTLVLLRP